MSASGVLILAAPTSVCGSGDAEGCGVGSTDTSVGSSVIAIEAAEILLLRAALADFTDLRFGGEAALGGDVGSATLSGGLKICDGSADSLTLTRRVRVAAFGVASLFVAFLRFARGVRDGAGVNSSSSSSVCGRRLTTVLSSSSLSSITLRRGAARLDGRTGDTDILLVSKSRFERSSIVSMQYSDTIRSPPRQSSRIVNKRVNT